MSERSPYTSCEVSQIEKTLLSSLDTYAKTEAPYRRATSHNVIFLGAKRDNTLEELIAIYSCYSPGRYFVLIEDEEIDNLSVEVGYQAVALTPEDYLYSDIIRISFSPDLQEQLLSVILSNLLGQVESELVALTEDIRSELFSLFVPMASSVLFYSPVFIKQLHILKQFSEAALSLIDLEWIALAPWRQELKEAFQKRGVRELLLDLSSIEIAYNQTQQQGIAITPLLFIGWILDSLSIKVQSTSYSGFECFSSTGKGIDVKLSQDEASSQEGITELRFFFEDQEQPLVCRRVEKQLETVIPMGKGYRISIPSPDTDMISCLHRYFGVGESVENYRSALVKALELEYLQRGLLGLSY